MTTRIQQNIELYRNMGGKLVIAVWVTNRKLRDTVASDGTAYTMDYGIESVTDKIVFDKAIRANSPIVKNAIERLKTQYPDAVIN
jgi:hypothetical protein